MDDKIYGARKRGKAIFKFHYDYFGSSEYISLNLTTRYTWKELCMIVKKHIKFHLGYSELYIRVDYYNCKDYKEIRSKE